jgi:hypothetical protein
VTVTVHHAAGCACGTNDAGQAFTDLICRDRIVVPGPAGEAVFAAAAEGLAAAFHETYERLAPEHGYKTREASAVPWHQVPAANRSLMRAVAAEIIMRFDVHVSLDELVCPGCGVNRDRSDGLCACPKLAG